MLQASKALLCPLLKKHLGWWAFVNSCSTLITIADIPLWFGSPKFRVATRIIPDELPINAKYGPFVQISNEDYLPSLPPEVVMDPNN